MKPRSQGASPCSPPAIVFLVAGEPSGDMLGARLIRTLRDRSPVPLKFTGVGGPLMQKEGLELVFPLSEIAVMGIAEVLPRLPRILRRLGEAVDAARSSRPAAVVTIDSSSFNKRFVRRLRKSSFGAPCIHYVAPMTWAWRPGRAIAMAQLFDHLMTLLPFEAQDFHTVGLPATWVGHPVVEAAVADGAEFRRRHRIDPTATVISLLPGSRSMEVNRLLSIFRETVADIHVSIPHLHTVIPTVGNVAALVRAGVRDWPTRVTVVEDEVEKPSAFAASDGALAASGTVTLELAVANVPMVVAYRASPITAFLARRLLKVGHLSLVNILADAPIVPEMLQEHCTAPELASAMATVLTDQKTRMKQLAAFRTVTAALVPPGPRTPSQRAADVVLSLAFPETPSQSHDCTNGEVTRNE